MNPGGDVAGGVMVWSGAWRLVDAFAGEGFERDASELLRGCPRVGLAPLGDIPARVRVGPC